jgi:hypothetical protein
MFFNVMEDSRASNLTVEEEETFGLQNAEFYEKSR